jgi:glutamate-ammonia-ligase adenylyltransferase
MTRIAYRDLAGLADALEISGELSDLAEACLHAGIHLVCADHDPGSFMAEEAAGHKPSLEGAQGGGPRPEIGMSSKPGPRHLECRGGEVLFPLHPVALGKLGSRQMHFSSDLDLLFLYDDVVPDSTIKSSKELQLLQDLRVARLLQLLAEVTTEGIAYRIDLRLRPEGPSGLLTRSWSGFVDHARHHMQPWERMTLAQSRILAESERARAAWADAIFAIVYDFRWDHDAVNAIRHVKRRIESETNKENNICIDFKFGTGGICDLDFLVQLLQVLHGRENPAVRLPSVDAAVLGLRDSGVLTEQDCTELMRAYFFQRCVENHYQLIEEWVSHEMSRESPALERLARSLGYPADVPRGARKAFLEDWECTARQVRRLVDKYFYGKG